jgi:hypothetical protein
MYAVKKIRINLSIEEDIKNHYVYREIHAMPLLNHKNVVRYYSCWVEAVETNDSLLRNIVKALNSNGNGKMLGKRKMTQKTKANSSDIEDIPDMTLIDATLLENDLISLDDRTFTANQLIGESDVDDSKGESSLNLTN